MNILLYCIGTIWYFCFSSVCVYGGGSRKNQISVVSKGVEIVVATPGRLNDLIAADIIKLTNVTYLVDVINLHYFEV